MEVVASGLGFVEGPVWHDDTLWFTSIDDGVVYAVEGWGDDGSATGVREAYRTGGGPNGMTVGPGGALYVTNNGGMVHEIDLRPSAIQRLEAGSVTDLVTTAGDVTLRACNDLCFGPDRRLYFTDPANRSRPPFEHPCLVCRLDLEAGEADVLHSGLQYSNGIAFHPDGDKLLVAESAAARITMFPWSAGGLGEPSIYCETGDPLAAPDGFCFDEEGNLYVAATVRGKVLVFDRDGKIAERLTVGKGTLPTNCCFGCPDGTTLYVTDSATMEHPPHEHRSRQQIVAFDVGVPGLPLLTGE